MPQPVEPDRTRRGVWLFPGLAAGALVESVIAAEQHGLDEVWIADEGVARDPVAVLAAAAAQTTSISLAIGVTSPVLRHPGAIAASIGTVDELSGGRAVLGLGVGGDLSLGPFGLAADRPIARLRDAIETIRAVHEGRATAHYSPPGHAMPTRSIPIWVGARGPQLVRTAARHADGLFLSGCTAEQQASIVANAATAGRPEIAIYQTAVDAPSRPSELGWDAAQVELRRDLERFGPGSIGLNLVQLADVSTDPLPLVERAAALLRSI